MTILNCSCCGNGFRGEQDPNHDTGFGTCADCEAWIGKREDAEWAKTQAMVANALNPANRTKFLKLEKGVQMGIVTEMVKDGIITYEIKASSPVRIT